MQAASAERYERVEVDFALSAGKFDSTVGVEELVVEKPYEVRYHRPEEEIA